MSCDEKNSCSCIYFEALTSFFLKRKLHLVISAQLFPFPCHKKGFRSLILLSSVHLNLTIYFVGIYICSDDDSSV